jgi:hypothetical protein
MASAWELPMRSKGIHYSFALLLSIGALGLSGCGGGDGDSARLSQTVDAAKNGVISIALADNPGYVHYKGFYQFELIGKDKDGKEISLTNKATWKISDPSLGSIKNGYLKAAGKDGENNSTTISAEYAGLPTAERTVVISNANLKSITIDDTSPSSGDECRNITFTAQAHFEGDLTLPYAMTWVVTEGNTLASFKDPATGVLRTLNSGAIKITAQAPDNNDKLIQAETKDVQIEDSLLGLTVESSKTGDIRDGETATLSVKGQYKSMLGTVDITDNATLSAAPTNLVAFDGAKITAQNGTAAGTKVIITGACGGQSDELELTVKEKQLKSIQIKNNNGGGTANLSVTEGNTVNLNVTATYIDDVTKDDYTNNVFWEIDEGRSADFNASMISISSSGEVNVSSDLNLIQPIVIYVNAEVRDASGNVLNGSGGTALTDDINITVNPN